ncbi:MAG: hypothetical protein M1825_000444 [Sarcosagium campestre]|nr:MAG: hypothetical protein M1825_000444 [Sarcosagium campestre]
MEGLQTRVLDALQPYIALSRSANSPRAATDLISQATSATNTYVFAELLNTPNVQSLRKASPEHASYLKLLEIFAWGTWQDYSVTPGLPTLNNAQQQKLRLLSLLPFAASTQPLTYANIQSSLGIDSARALESLVIRATYVGLLTAKLSPRTQLVHISSTSPLRDLPPGSVPRLLSSLDDWDTRCDSVLGDIESQIQSIRARALQRRQLELEQETALESAIAKTVKLQSAKRAADGTAEPRTDGGAGSQEPMDLDEIGHGGARAGAGQRKTARTKFNGATRRFG